MKKEDRLLRMGVLGCGPISQFAHFEACRRARNAELYAICDRATDLVGRMAVLHNPQKTYTDYAAMLADPQVEAVIIATADAFHVGLCRQAIAAGKHVLVEKPMGVTVEECDALRQEVRASGLTLQVGYMKRFDPGLAFVHEFAKNELGQRLSFKSCYHDSIYRYTMTDNLQVIPMASPQALRPEGNPKADKRRYFMLTHGSHLVDTARYLGGEIERVNARLVERFGAYCWYIAVDFADGSVGHLDLIVAVRGDWREDFQLEAEHGNASGRIHLPWFHKTSEVEVFSTKDGVYRRPLGEDAHTYKRQVEGFAETILHGVPQHGADVDDGAAGVRVLVAISQSVERGEAVKLADVTGGLGMNIGIFAKTFVRPSLTATLDAVQAHGLDCVQFNLACAGLPSMPDAISDAVIEDIRQQMAARQMTMAALSGTFNMIHPDMAQREAGLRRLAVLAAACGRLGTGIITLCTGTRDPQNMWNRHPDNDTPEAWRDLLACLAPALEIAEQHDLTLAFEPEVANVIDTAAKGRRLLDEVRSPRLKVVLDAANLFRAGDLARMPAVLQEAFDHLGGDIVIAHAKDLARDGEAGHQAAGTGVLDYDRYLTLLKQAGYDGALILHSLEEDQVDPAVAFLRGKLAQLGAA